MRLLAKALTLAFGIPIAASGQTRRECRITFDSDQYLRVLGFSFRDPAVIRAGVIVRAAHPLITTVRPRSPAAAAGLRPQDEVVAIAGFDPVFDRDSVRTIRVDTSVHVVIRRGVVTFQRVLIPEPPDACRR
jgi:predicted metalloprotease with PDZ domain